MRSPLPLPVKKVSIEREKKSQENTADRLIDDRPAKITEHLDLDISTLEGAKKGCRIRPQGGLRTAG